MTKYSSKSKSDNPKNSTKISKRTTPMSDADSNQDYEYSKPDLESDPDSPVVKKPKAPKAAKGQPSTTQDSVVAIPEVKKPKKLKGFEGYESPILSPMPQLGKDNSRCVV